MSTISIGVDAATTAAAATEGNGGERIVATTSNSTGNDLARTRPATTRGMPSSYASSQRRASQYYRQPTPTVCILVRRWQYTLLICRTQASRGASSIPRSSASSSTTVPLPSGVLKRPATAGAATTMNAVGKDGKCACGVSIAHAARMHTYCTRSDSGHTESTWSARTLATHRARYVVCAHTRASVNAPLQLARLRTQLQHVLTDTPVVHRSSLAATRA